MRVRVCMCAQMRQSAHACVAVPSVRLLISAWCPRGHRARARILETNQMYKRHHAPSWGHAVVAVRACVRVRACVCACIHASSWQASDSWFQHCVHAAVGPARASWKLTRCNRDITRQARSGGSVCMCAQMRQSAHACVAVPSVRLLISAWCPRGHRARARILETNQMYKRHHAPSPGPCSGGSVCVCVWAPECACVRRCAKRQTPGFSMGA